ncbi:MAG: hypothetical protein EHM41_15555 [Chloroflexi bacterium]|nr:MAG: hypothetical protein EHM41_15555 [Chloroflexota bacterium]
MENKVFDVLILTGRPASGKSEIIDFILRTSPEQRVKKFHIGDLTILDDFPMLWTWFEEDAILSQILSKPRLHTDEDGYFKYDHLWDLLVERINLDFRKLRREISSSQDKSTTIIEFSRGTEHGGYQRALSRLSKDIFARSGVLYVNVSYEESLRKNRRRFNPQRPDSILEHSLPDEKLERLYRYDDWSDLTADDPEFLTINGIQVPYVVFDNLDDVTTNNPEMLKKRLLKALNELYNLGC